tara:strand:- start:1317 stop:2303 length:987 start_codon:yes stop_codon:yes gene_type:complete
MVSNSVDNIVIDCLQYANWSPKVFKQMREGNVDCVHVTIAYHENFRETVLNLEKWNTYFSKYSDLIVQAFNAEDIVKTKREKKTSIIFGFQNPSPIEDDIGLIEIWQKLGIKFMQLTYNNQSLLASGCYETNDAGISRMGKEVIKEMNRVGMVIDMSHSSERSTLEAIEHSSKPISITHANPSFWHPAKRNKSNTILKCLSESGGMLGLSLYPHHLKNGSMCELNDFCDMIVRTVDLIGIKNIGIGSDLCQDQPDTIVEWMRNGRWTKDTDFGEGSIENPGFPKQPNWFKDNRDFNNISKGLKKVGLSSENIKDIMGRNWLNFFKKSF